ncbi:MAG: O-antigen ligase domain-containing protein [Planctomycetota bacterium]
MNALGYLVLYAWFPIVLAMFAYLKHRVAVAMAFAAGWCFLPIVRLRVPSLPDYSKISATSSAVLLGTLLFHTWLFTRFRLKFIDLPILIYCASPIMSSTINGLGVRDGLASSLVAFVFWGMPYLAGRLHFTRLEHLRDLAIPLIVTALIYVPLCLWEIRMSPQLHRQIYGVATPGFLTNIRYGGFRPTVFMSHGLQVALWLSIAFVLTASLWWIGRQKSMRILRFGVPLSLLAMTFFVTLVLSKSLGALMLALGGLACLFLAVQLRMRWPLLMIPVACVIYIITRSTGIWSGSHAYELARLLDPDRANSLNFRFHHENMLAEKARAQPIFGWGGWGRNRIFNEYGDDVSVVDGLWILTFGVNGLLGLVSLYTAKLAGPVLMILRMNPRSWRNDSTAAIGIAFTLICLIAAADSLPNNMPIPVVILTLGAISGIASNMRRTAAQPRMIHEPLRGYAA